MSLCCTATSTEVKSRVPGVGGSHRETPSPGRRSRCQRPIPQRPRPTPIRKPPADNTSSATKRRRLPRRKKLFNSICRSAITSSLACRYSTASENRPIEYTLRRQPAVINRGHRPHSVQRTSDGQYRALANRQRPLSRTRFNAAEHGGASHTLNSTYIP